MVTEICRKLGERSLAAFRLLWRDEEATTTLEYALVLALVSISAIAAYQALAEAVNPGVGTEELEASDRGRGLRGRGPMHPVGPPDHAGPPHPGGPPHPPPAGAGPR